MCSIFFRIGIAAHVYLIRNVFFISDNIITRWLMAFSEWWTTSVGVQSPSYIITSSDFGFVETSVGTQLSISQLHHHITGPSTRLWFCQKHPDKIRLGIVSVLWNINNVWRCFWNFIIYDYSALCALLIYLSTYPQLQCTMCSTCPDSSPRGVIGSGLSCPRFSCFSYR